MKKLLFIALLGSAFVMMSCGGASTKTVNFDDSTVVEDSVLVDSLNVDSINGKCSRSNSNN